MTSAPTNRIAQLCARGMSAETDGRPDQARRCYEQAWAESTDPFEACIAAHYLARQQATPAATLMWNRRALDRATAADPVRVQGFLASLHLNVGKSHEDVGEPDQARRHYLLAHARLVDVPASGYRDLVERGVRAGLDRVGS